MDVIIENQDLTQVCAEAFSSVNDRRKASIAKFRSQGYKMVMTHNGYVDNANNTLLYADGQGYCDDDLAVGDKCALLQSGDFNRPLDIEITEINKLPWCDRQEYSFKYL